MISGSQRYTTKLRSVSRASLVLAAFLCAAICFSGCGQSALQKPEDVAPGGETSMREASGAETSGSETSDRPNIVFIVTDDQDKASASFMPEVQSELMEKGATFDNAFVTNALCCPSRATILTGRYSHNHEIVGNEWPRGGYRKFQAQGLEDSTIATLLDSGGYRTAYFGKYLNGYRTKRIPPGWDDWHVVAGNYLSNYLNENGEITYYDPARYHDTDVLADRAVEYVHDSSGEEKDPFFMLLSPRAPHEPALPAPRHRGDFAEAELPRTPAFNEEDVSDKPAWVRQRPRLSNYNAFSMDYLYRSRLESLQSVDEMVGRLVDTLRETGELDNTYIFFTSDNGYHMGQHRLGTGKWTAYEEDIKVPLAVRGPGVEAGREVDSMTLNNDFAPTFADLAGLGEPALSDGRSLATLMTSRTSTPERWRSSFLVEAASQEISGRPGLSAIRTERHVYTEYDNGERELYDLDSDPYQLENIYEDAEPDLLRHLEERLDELKTCSGNSCRVAEGE